MCGTVISRNCNGEQFSTRKGITLIELFGVVVVLSILLALLLPAIIYAREHSRRVTCINNLKQIGIAFQAHSAIHKKIPSAGLTLFSELAPQLELDSFFVPEDSENVSAFGPSVVCCPSDPLCDIANRNQSYFLNNGSRISPRDGCVAETRIPISERLKTRKMDFSLFVDGLSNSALLCEHKVFTASSNKSLIWWRSDRRFGRGEEDPMTEYVKRGIGNRTILPDDTIYFGETVLNSQFYCDHILSPNHWKISLVLDPRQSWYDMVNPSSSYHFGGVVSLIADGSVRFFSNGVDIHVWRATGSVDSTDVPNEAAK